ncbi:SusC/RagA family TonB-linked outer membrane protein [Algoriphagus zhangzhouensis]|uniref:TonB-linked outer membrane protein, SusC/RagA family n=1 Tax=Algoriphagus zhangzhouensis TaxID=1073327 RepID=A0A1M7Z918_9BACT|nr:SusC/RagA family TonB-linked outer membrane protein [Algoriphagus zhangzhouensis]TDY47473.1 TonB-linked SusC/RagA family outer membrane protein [Algoriphagus zhangzhouensis]SHO61428.1 TonB-linked outer membrane protein, SusC/RagA family [Algoriphagus zhangzhouensis]
MRKALLFVVALFTMTLSYEVSAQQRVITGTVISDEDGLGLPGATVLVKGTTVGTTTDLDGNYSISVPAGSDVLIFSFVGLETHEETIGNRSVIDVTLTADAAQLSEVVVTAIGIEREKKALGYAVTTVGDEQLENRPEQDVARVLQGKVPGVNITSTNGMSGSGTNMVIRGYSSATGSNQPLFVVDGVPFNTSTNNTNGFTTGGATTSSRFLDIDPNNIESMSVLKGLSATVLYGDQGRNGVILITTKSGASKRKAAEVTVNQSVFSNKAASLPTYGYEYGNGFQQSPGFFFSNFGPRLDIGLTVAHPYATSSIASIREAFPQFWVDGIVGGTPVQYEYKAYEDPSTAFFRTGLVSNTSIQIAGGSDRTSFSASFGYTDDKGFVPGNELKKYNFGLGVRSSINDKLSVNSSFTFAITDLESPPVNASYGSGPSGGIPSVFAHVLYTPRSIDLAGLPFENPVDNSSVYYRAGNNIVNPKWLAKYYKNTSDVNRFFNSTSLIYDFNDNFSVTYRIGLDTYTEKQEKLYNKGAGSGSAAIQSGMYTTANIVNTIWNQDLIFNWKKEFSDKFGMSALLGGNSRYDSFVRDGIESQGQLAFGLFRHSNFTSASHGGLNVTSEQRRMGVYANLTLDYSNYLYFTLSARNDWTSTVEKENRRILYPGASVSFIPSTAFDWNSSTINDLKLRLGYGTSAGFPSPYSTRNTLAQNAIAFSRDGTLTQTHSVSNALGNPNLKPELIQELEFGVEAVMFNNKLRFDLSMFEKNTNDLITQSPIDPATGFTTTAINIGNIRTRGVELQANVTPVSTASGFTWNSTVNWSLYRSVTTELGAGLEEIVVAGFTTLGNFAIPGEPFNVIKGTGFLRDDEGNPIVLSDGLYAADPELQILGDPNPRWTGSWINTFSWKGFTFNAMLEYRHKGAVFSNTVTATLARGVTKDPVADREMTFIMPGVRQDGTNADGSPNYIKNDIQISASDYFFGGYQGRTDAPNVFDGSMIRLREISLGYELPSTLLAKTPFKRASVALSGTNLWFLALNFPPNMNYDVDVLGTGVGNGLGFDFVTGPSSKRFGGTVTLAF